MVAKQNNRLFPRYNFEGPLKFQVRGSNEVVNTVGDDLSQSGVGFVHQKFLPPATTINLEINLSNRVLRPIGKVMWSSPMARSDKYRLGVNFIEFDYMEKKFLEDFLRMKKNQLL